MKKKFKKDKHGFYIERTDNHNMHQCLICDSDSTQSYSYTDLITEKCDRCGSVEIKNMRWYKSYK